MSANTVVIEGRLGKDPEKRGNDAGPVVFNICWDKRTKDKITGEWSGSPHWFTVKVFGRDRDAALRLTKGDKVLVSGQLQDSTYTDKEGNKKYGVDIVAYSVGVVPRTDAAATGESPDW